MALSLVDAYLRWFYLCAYPAAPVAGLGEDTDVAWWTLPALLRQAGSLLQPQSSTSSTSTILSLAFWRQHQESDHKSSLSSFLPPAVASSVEADGTQGMVMSYLMVWVATATELLAFHATVTAGSMAWIRWQRARRGRGQQQEMVPVQHGMGEAETEDGDDDDGGDDASSSSSSEASSTSLSSTNSNSGPIDHPPPNVTLLDLYRPQLISTALLLSSLSTLLLLSIVLLWESKLPRPGSGDGEGQDDRHRSSSSLAGPTTIGDLLPTLLLSSPLFTTYLPTTLRTTLTTLPLPHLSTDFAVRTLLGGLSAGVCLAVVHPREPLLTTSLLLVGWTVASGGVRGRWTLLPGEAGPGGAGGCVGGGMSWEQGRARGLYCAL